MPQAPLAPALPEAPAPALPGPRRAGEEDRGGERLGARSARMDSSLSANRMTETQRKKSNSFRDEVTGPFITYRTCPPVSLPSPRVPKIAPGAPRPQAAARPTDPEARPRIIHEPEVERAAVAKSE